MNKLIVAVTASLLVTGAAMAAEVPTPPAKPAVVEAPTKKVCHTKDGKQVCKNIKVHKKAEKVTSGAPTDPAKKK